MSKICVWISKLKCLHCINIKKVKGKIVNYTIFFLASITRNTDKNINVSLYKQWLFAKFGMMTKAQRSKFS